MPTSNIANMEPALQKMASFTGVGNDQYVRFDRPWSPQNINAVVWDSTKY